MFSSIRKAPFNMCKFFLEKGSTKIREATTISLCKVNDCVLVHTNSCSKQSIPVKEISIPIPYGQLAAKAWGQENGHPVIALHGWMDNCGTFDKLIPLLEKSLYIVALDLPGHGFSSRIPNGCFYTYVDMILAIDHAKTFLGWKKLHFIGHSTGGELAQLYTGFYPELVDKIILLDVIKPVCLAPEDIPERFVKAMDANIEIEKKLSGKPPLYSMESALKRLIKGMYNEITPESGEVLLRRGIQLSDCGGGHIFTRDLRLRNIEDYYIMSNQTLQAFMSRLKSEMLIVRPNNVHPAYASQNSELDSTFIDIYTKNCKYFSMENVEGNHFVHLNNPERVAPLINKFISARK